MAETIHVPLVAVDEFARRLPEPGSVDVTIEVMGMEVGDQVEAQRLPWHRLIHDRSTLEISVGGRDRSVPVVLRHEIKDPASLWAEEEAGLVRSFSIEDREGVQTVVRFHDRPALGSGSEG